MDSELPFKRIVAFLIDRCVGLAPTFFFGIMFFIFLGANVEEAAIVMLILTVVAYFLLDTLYMLMRDGLFDGRSVGKKVMNLQVLNRKNQPCGIGRSFLRNLPFLISILTFVELILIFVKPGRRLGDRMAKTRVISKRT
jgi:uncharacterized RDD family membrane protein YckC